MLFFDSHRDGFTVLLKRKVTHILNGLRERFHFSVNYPFKYQLSLNVSPEFPPKTVCGASFLQISQLKLCLETKQ